MNKNKLIFMSLTVLSFVLCLITSSFAQTAKGQPTLKKLCREDVKKYCADIKPGGGRIRECLKAHLNDLSSVCKEGLSKIESLRNAAPAQTTK